MIYVCAYRYPGIDNLNIGTIRARSEQEARDLFMLGHRGAYIVSIELHTPAQPARDGGI